MDQLVTYLWANPWLAALAAGLLLFAGLLAVWAALRRRARTARAVPHVGTARSGLLLVETGGAVHPVEALPATLGRAPEATVVLRDPAISGIHARIYYDETLAAVCVEDCDSTNGLYVDGQPTRKNQLHDNARITLGATTVTFQDGTRGSVAVGQGSQGTAP